MKPQTLLSSVIAPKEFLPGWAILPLRLFLGLSFVIAGLDKLTDPTFLDPAAPTYIGRQIAAFAPGTPLEGFLLNVAVPNATLFGVLTMGGELCVGLAVLLGLLTRFSALVGLQLSLTFFLSATWGVRPFYFGADLPYAAGWLTLLLAGPGPLALDAAVRRWLRAHSRPASALLPPAPAALPLLTRRAFLGMGAAGLAGTVLAGSGLGWGLLHPRRAAALDNPTPPTPAAPPAAVPPPPTPAAGTGARTLLAAPGALPAGQALEFVLPTGEPAVLVHNDAGYSAYVALCTHQGCAVKPVGSGLLACPCHGAQFDPAAAGKAVRGPARLPLAPVAVSVDPDGGVYLAE